MWPPACVRSLGDHAGSPLRKYTLHFEYAIALNIVIESFSLD